MPRDYGMAQIAAPSRALLSFSDMDAFVSTLPGFDRLDALSMSAPSALVSIPRSGSTFTWAAWRKATGCGTESVHPLGENWHLDSDGIYRQTTTSRRNCSARLIKTHQSEGCLVGSSTWQDTAEHKCGTDESWWPQLGQQLSRAARWALTQKAVHLLRNPIDNVIAEWLYNNPPPGTPMNSDVRSMAYTNHGRRLSPTRGLLTPAARRLGVALGSAGPRAGGQPQSSAPTANETAALMAHLAGVPMGKWRALIDCWAAWHCHFYHVWASRSFVDLWFEALMSDAHGELLRVLRFIGASPRSDASEGKGTGSARGATTDGDGGEALPSWTPHSLYPPHTRETPIHAALVPPATSESMARHFAKYAGPNFFGGLGCRRERPGGALPVSKMCEWSR